MSHTDLLDYLNLGTILKIMVLLHIDLLGLYRIWKVSQKVLKFGFVTHQNIFLHLSLKHSFYDTCIISSG